MRFLVPPERLGDSGADEVAHEFGGRPGADVGGVGLFLGLIGLKTAGIVVDSPATLLTMGSFGEPTALLAAVCFLMIAVLSHRNVFGAILLSMLAVTGIGWVLGLVEYNGLVSMPPSLAPTWLAMLASGAAPR